MRIAIVGAGSVGATAAYACLLRGVAEELAMSSGPARSSTAAASASCSPSGAGSREALAASATVIRDACADAGA